MGQVEDALFQGLEQIHTEDCKKSKKFQKQKPTLVHRSASTPNNFKKPLLLTLLAHSFTSELEKCCLIRNKTNNDIKKAKYMYYYNKGMILSEPSCSSTTWWRTVRELSELQEARTAGAVIPPFLDQSRGQYVTDDNHKAELFNETFFNQQATKISSPKYSFMRYSNKLS